MRSIEVFVMCKRTFGVKTNTLKNYILYNYSGQGKLNKNGASTSESYTSSSSSEAINCYLEELRMCLKVTIKVIHHNIVRNPISTFVLYKSFRGVSEYTGMAP